MNNKVLLLFITLCYLNTSHLLAQAVSDVKGGMSAQRLGHYENFIEKEIKEGNIAGAVSLVWRKGEITHDKTFGYNNIETKAPMDDDNIFYIQSMTKPIITVAFMMLYEEGHFQLTDPVSKYIPEFENLKVSKDVTVGVEADTEELKDVVTIAQVLSHSAGFSHGLGGTKLDREYAQAMYGTQHPDIESRVMKMLEMPLMYQPGEAWLYSAAPDVLSLLIQKFSGIPTREFIQQRIFDPLNMDDTGYNVDKEDQNRMAALHGKDAEGNFILSPRQQPMSGNTIDSGVNGLFSTASDYLTFSRMLLNNGELDGKRYLSRKTVGLMTQNHVGDLYTKGGNDPGNGFGFGFGVVTDVAATKELGSVGKYYWSGAFCTYFFIDPKEEMIALLMTQTFPYTGYYGSKMSQFVYQAIVD